MKYSFNVTLISLFVFVDGLGCSDSHTIDSKNDSVSDGRASHVTVGELIPSFSAGGICEKIYFGNIWLVAAPPPDLSWNWNEEEETLWFADCLFARNGDNQTVKRQVQFYFTTLPETSSVEVFQSFFGIGEHEVLLKKGDAKYREQQLGKDWSEWKSESISRNGLPIYSSTNVSVSTETRVTIELDWNTLTVPFKDIEQAIVSLSGDPPQNASPSLSETNNSSHALSYKMISNLRESSIVRNSAANELFSLPELPDGVVGDLARMFASPDEDEVWRDYCLQFLGSALERTDGVTDEDRALARETLVEALDSTNATFAGTALRALHRGDPADPLVASNALRIARDPSYPSSSRTTALLVLEECTSLGADGGAVTPEERLSVLRETADALARDPSASSLLRQTAEAVLKRIAD